MVRSRRVVASFGQGKSDAFCVLSTSFNLALDESRGLVATPRSDTSSQAAAAASESAPSSADVSVEWKEVGRTEVCDDNLSPIWNQEEFIVPLPMDTSDCNVRIECYDWDKKGGHEWLGESI